MAGNSRNAEQWLEQQLVGMKDALPYMDSDMAANLVASCQGASDADVADYLLNIAGDTPSVEEVIAEYLRLRQAQVARVPSKGLREALRASPGSGLQAYVKPSGDEVLTVGSSAKKVVPGGTRPAIAHVGGEGGAEGSAGFRKVGAMTVTVGGGGKGKNKKGREVGLAELESGKVVFGGGRPCDCMAGKHLLINNCLSCGKVVCEQEGEGPCRFCGTLVLREGSKYGGMEEGVGGGVGEETEAERQAVAFKNRLVDYDRTAAQRTAVIDDQSDYFEMEGDAWLSPEEKSLLAERKAIEEAAKEAKRKRMTVTFDLIGRKVVLEEEGQSLLDSHPPPPPRIQVNPTLHTSPPVFIPPPTQPVSDRPAARRGPGGVVRRIGVQSRGKGKARGRIQHDDPLVEALQGVGGGVEETGRGWQTGEECTPSPSRSGNGMAAKDSVSFARSEQGGVGEGEGMGSGVFDICEGVGAGDGDGEGWVEWEGRGKVEVLMEGMGVMRGWLTGEEQISILRWCRDRGVGLGGFYLPTFPDGSSMKVHMMCLGRHWEPRTRKYEERRGLRDRAEPPLIPPFLGAMVKRAVGEARAGGVGVPEMDPQLCLVNFYGRKGAMGVHQVRGRRDGERGIGEECEGDSLAILLWVGFKQDKDETPESIARGAPVVSFSIGDSAQFLYKSDGDPDKFSKFVLASGDVVVFGGKARSVVHGISKVFVGSAPKWLRGRTGLIPGRLNLTFREL